MVVALPGNSGLSGLSAMVGGGIDWTAIPSIAARYDIRAANLAVALDGTGGVPADAGVCGRVSDLSGNAYHLTTNADAARPTYYDDAFNLGRPGLYFSGTTIRLYNAAGLANRVFNGVNKSWTIIIASCRRTEPGSNGHFFGVCKAATAMPPVVTTFLLNAQGSQQSASRPWMIAGYARDGDAVLASGQTFVDGNNGIGYGGAGIVVHSWVKNGQATTLYQNGKVVSTATQSSGTWTLDAADLVCVGGVWNGATQTGSLSGFLFAMLICETNLADIERQAVEREYLTALGVPYQPDQTPKRWHEFGHSHVASQLPTSATASHRMLQKARLPVDECVAQVIKGQSGVTLTEGVADADDILDSFNTFLSSAPNVVSGDTVSFGPCITNDVNGDSIAADTDADVEDMVDVLIIAQRGMCETALTRTDRVLWVCDPPRNDMASTHRQYGLRYACEQAKIEGGRFDRVEVVDAWTPLANGNALAAAYDSGDGLHPNNAGFELIANLKAAAAARLRAVDPAATAIRFYTARTGTRFADGGEIGDVGLTLVDRSSNVDHATQSTAGSRPVWKLGVAGTNWRPWVDFDGTDDYLSFTRVNLAAWTMMLVVDNDASGGGRILQDESGASPASYLRINSTTELAVRDTNGQIVTFTLPAAMAASDVIVIRSDRSCWLNGAAASAAGAWTGNLAADTIGKANVTFFKGKLFDLLLDNSALSDAAVNLRAKCLAEKHGKTWTAI